MHTPCELNIHCSVTALGVKAMAQRLEPWSLRSKSNFIDNWTLIFFKKKHSSFLLFAMNMFPY